ncbi:MAG: hypothetical protein M9959_07130 [Chitinophagaceae bacterium]|nr:hypothetical protein [Chitinophagaceae bacterium]
MKVLKIIQTSLLSLLGTVTVFMTVSIIFDFFGIREREGNYVLFVVYTNLACGILYLIAAYTIWVNPKLSFKQLVVSLFLLIIAFIVFQLYISYGGVYEKKTVYALLFRIVFTLMMTLIGWLVSKKKKFINKV